MKLIHGDCLKMMREMADNSVDAIVTDPPYGILKHRIEQPIDITAFFQESLRILKQNSFIVYFGRQPTLTDWNSIAFKYFKYKTEIIWYKRQRASPMNDIGNYFENITILVKGSQRLNDARLPYTDIVYSLAEFHSWDALDRMVGAIKTVFSTKQRYEDAIKFMADQSSFFTVENKSAHNSATMTRPPRFSTDRCFGSIQQLTNGYAPRNVVSFMPHNKQSRDMSGEGKGDHNIKHPTVKPIQLMEYLIDLVSKQGDVILDPFIGSGTTGLACKNLDRDFIGIELDEEYFEIARQRIEVAAKVEEKQLMLSL